MSKKKKSKAIGRFALGGGKKPPPRDFEIDRMYPDAKAREHADTVLDALDDRTTTSARKGLR